jgi:hypothetical protein
MPGRPFRTQHTGLPHTPRRASGTPRPAKQAGRPANVGVSQARRGRPKERV